MATLAREERDRRQEELEAQYAPRRPMTQLPEKYRVTETQPEPPLLHFAIPVDTDVLCKYAKKYGLFEYFPNHPGTVSPVTLIEATERLSQEVDYKISLCWPFRITAESEVILGLYSNYTMDRLKLIDEHEENVIEMVQEDLELDASVWPKWYFDFHDPWRPGMEE